MRQRVRLIVWKQSLFAVQQIDLAVAQAHNGMVSQRVVGQLGGCNGIREGVLANSLGGFGVPNLQRFASCAQKIPAMHRGSQEVTRDLGGNLLHLFASLYAVKSDGFWPCNSDLVSLDEGDLVDRSLK